MGISVAKRESCKVKVNMCDFQLTGGAPVRIRIIVYKYVSTDSADQNVTWDLIRIVRISREAWTLQCSAKGDRSNALRIVSPIWQTGQNLETARWYYSL